MIALDAEADVLEVEDSSGVREAFSGSGCAKPRVIPVTDAALLASTRIGLLQEVAAYAYAGGALILWAIFASTARPSDINSMGLPWTTGDYHRATFNLN